MPNDPAKAAAETRTALCECADGIVQVITRYYAPTVEALKVARMAMQNFVDKCDTGRASSKDSYAKFCAALARIEKVMEGAGEVDPAASKTGATPDRPPLVCFDCGLSYDDAGWVEVTVEKRVWTHQHPYS